jgi:hypothetical protein
MLNALRSAPWQRAERIAVEIDDALGQIEELPCIIIDAELRSDFVHVQLEITGG